MSATSMITAFLATLVSLLFTGCATIAKEAKAPEVPREPVKQTLQATSKVKALTKPPEVTAELDEGFQDLVFWLEEHEEQDNGTHRIRAAGTHKGKKVSFEILLSPKWTSGMTSPITAHTGTVTYRTIGTDSDAFLSALDQLYETKLSPKTMTKEVEFNAVSLEGHPGELEKGPVKIKLFFEPENPDDYLELYTNIDLQACRVEVREKDMEYRPAVIKALQGKSKLKEK